MMAQVCTLNDTIEEPEPRAKQRFSLDESCGQVHLGSEGGDAEQRWYLDSGASNHMTGDKEAFAELDGSVVGSVKFGDSSSVDIRGRSTIIFKCQNGEHLALTDVYNISKLCSSIVSIKQLDERWCQVLIDSGVLRIRDHETFFLPR
jgi:hypothetical protein